ncbi:MAG: TetR/AcrR family transcriptional regulator, partial [Chloroflexi bacterium]|nr:TetR/AcrR family transcriptional regulator [Chloroflexota bacterium]
LRLFRGKGYEGTSLRELAAACKMSVGSIYNYVGTKQDILYLIMEEFTVRPPDLRGELLKYYEKGEVAAALKEFIHQFFLISNRHQEYILFTYQEARHLGTDARSTIRKVADEDMAILEELLRLGMKTGEFVVNNPTVTAHSIISLAHMWAIRRRFLKDKCNIDEYIETVTDMILKSVTPLNKT